MGGKPRAKVISLKLTLLAEELNDVIDKHNTESLLLNRHGVTELNERTTRTVDALEHTMHKLIEDALPKEAAQRFREIRSQLDEVRDDMSYD